MAPDLTNINGVDMGNIASINGQDAPSGGGTATTTPALSLAGGGFGFVTATITKSGGGTYTNPNYQVITTLADGTVTVTDANVNRSLESDESHITGVLTLQDTNASTAERTVTVKAQEFGDTIQSAAATATFTPSYLQKEYIRIQACTSDGSNIAANQAILDVAFFTGSGQSGTEYPTTNLTANDSETDIVVSAGHTYGSGTYDPWKAFDSNVNGTLGWNLQGGTNDNWFQIQFQDGTYDTKPLIKSMKIKFYSTFHATHFKITGSDNADHSSATTLGPFPVTNSSNTYINVG
tara:strand:+ start:613 stop:1491 length:879 start_codon:yes stop_codon:yes gene_type:complete